MKCASCKFMNPENSVYCGNCGSCFEKECVCANCGSHLPISFKFCNKCGFSISRSEISSHTVLSLNEKLEKVQRYLPKGLAQKVLSQRNEIEGERKLVTVMFCDMQGFTPLSEQLGPEAIYAIMDKVYECLIHKVHDFEGTVNEFTGDGIMALFGAPIALEDAPQRAIRSAHSIHKEIAKLSNNLRREKSNIPPIKMRIGINTGTVVVGTLGNDLRVEFKAVGDTVNLASRMESIADSGSTFVTDATFRLTEGFFRYEAMGEYEIKGKRSPVRAYRVLGPKNRRTRFDVSTDRGLTSFIGREREIELLIDGLERAKDGRGQAFSIVSEAGVGKSRLLYEFRKAIDSEDVTFLEGKCLSYSKGVPYHLHIDTLKANFDIKDGDIESTIRHKVQKGLRRLNADETTTLPYFLELLSVRNSGLDNGAMSPDTKKDRILEAFKIIILKGCEVRPLVLAYDDLHWIDQSSLDYLKYILEIIPGARILLIFTYRSAFMPIFGAKSYHSQIVLNRLSNRESLVMASQMLGEGTLDRKLEEYILEKSDGVPFFIEELIKSLNESKVIRKKDNVYCITQNIEELAIPATVQDVIMVRIDALPDKGKQFLQTASAIGRVFSHDLIKQVAELPQDEMLSTLSLLKDSEHIYERGVYPQSSYLFKHALTQEMAYDSLLSKNKKLIHEKIGNAIEQISCDNLEEHYEILVHHYGCSENHSQTLKYLDLANQKAARICAMNEAKVYFDKAMQLLDRLADTEQNRHQRISLLAKQGAVVELLFNFQEYYDLLIRYEPVARGLDNQEFIGAYYGQLGQCHFAFGHYDHAIKTLSRAVALCERAKQFEEAAHAYAYLILSHLDRGNYEAVITLKKNLSNFSGRRSNVRWHVRGLAAICNAYAYIGNWCKAIKHGRLALDLAMKSSDESLVSLAASNLSLSYCWQGNYGKAVRYGRLSVEKATTPGDKARSKRSLGWALCRSENTEQGIKTLTDAVLPIFKSGGFRAFEIPLLCYLGEGYLLNGDQAKALKTLKEGLKLADKSDAKFFIGFSNRMIARIIMDKYPSQAASLLKRSVSIFHEIKAENEMATAIVDYGRLCKAQSDEVAANKLFKKALGIYKRLGTIISKDAIEKLVC